MMKKTFWNWYPTIWKKAGIAFSIVLIIVAHMLLLIPNIPLGEGNTWSGWREAAQKIDELQKAEGGREKNFIFANSMGN